jgi:hypothetical protein
MSDQATPTPTEPTEDENTLAGVLTSYEDEPAVEPAPEPVAYELPEQYKGKSVQDMVQLIEESQRFNGKQSNEIGELRQMVDKVLQVQAKDAEPVVELDTTDYFTDPQGAIDKAVAAHPSVKGAEDARQLMIQQAAKAALNAKHPDTDTVLSDPAFAAWVNKSVTRKRLLENAHTQYDADAADELISSFKEIKALKAATVSGEEAARKTTAKAAGTGNARGSNANTGGKKKYRREDIIDLAVTNPSRYKAMAPEILLAYEEGRVI